MIDVLKHTGEVEEINKVKSGFIVICSSMSNATGIDFYECFMLEKPDCNISDYVNIEGSFFGLITINNKTTVNIMNARLNVIDKYIG